MKRKSACLEMSSSYEKLKETLLEREKVYKECKTALENCLEENLDAFLKLYTSSKKTRIRHLKTPSTIPKTILEEEANDNKSNQIKSGSIVSNRPRRHASEKATVKINKHINLKLNEKLRRNETVVKIEKLDPALLSSNNKIISKSNEEKNDENKEPNTTYLKNTNDDLSETASESESEFKIPGPLRKTRKIKKEPTNEKIQSKKSTKSSSSRSKTKLKKQYSNDEDVIEVEKKISIVDLSSSGEEDVILANLKQQIKNSGNNQLDSETNDIESEKNNETETKQKSQEASAEEIKETNNFNETDKQSTNKKQSTHEKIQLKKSTKSSSTRSKTKQKKQYMNDEDVDEVEKNNCIVDLSSSGEDVILAHLKQKIKNSGNNQLDSEINDIESEKNNETETKQKSQEASAEEIKETNNFNETDKQSTNVEILNESVYEDAVQNENKIEDPQVQSFSIVLQKSDEIDRLSSKLKNSFVVNQTYCKDVSKNMNNETFVVNKTPEKEKKQMMTSLMLSPVIAARVAEFEKLVNNDPPLRVTRSKMNVQKINEEKVKNNSTSDENSSSEIMKDSGKVVWTPSVRTTPLVTSSSNYKSSGRIGRVEMQEKREAEQRKKLEKREGVQRKKEAQIQAKIEEQRKKHEERLLKVQQARIAKEKERQIAIEKAEKEKERKNKQIKAAREEQMKKELQQKRALAAQRMADIEERRKAEEAARQARLQEQEEAERRAEAQRRQDYEEAERLRQKRLEEERAEYARAKARAQALALQKIKQQNKIKSGTPSAQQPISKVPVASNLLEELKSDDSTDDEDNSKRPVPDWCLSANRRKNCRIQDDIPISVVNKFFSARPTLIDLSELFHNIDRRLLKRNSSAVWRTPPRYSRMHKH